MVCAYLFTDALGVLISRPDPAQECAAYYYADTGDKLSSFPDIWSQPANIVSGDTTAQDKFNSINSSIPTDIQPRVSLQSRL